ncbi:protein CURLY FLAG LEAF 1-like [Cornus florida]|uniref:protein CURLY FLAG LEAF 1-like n=1 Tax=Cornus florida TaxID=4283 RepID=UPI0028A14BBD|nr:protein CURLY FLAG LEAF 1-like [Cornus florida]
MIKKLIKQEMDHEEDHLKKMSQQFWRTMKVPELSLAPTRCVVDDITNNSLPDSENYNLSRKRKSYSDRLLKSSTTSQPLSRQTSTVDLQLKDPLPLDWEQCLDLESGRMYYLNRKTLKKSWEWPEDQNLDLELNISTSSEQYCSSSGTLQDAKKQQQQQQHSSTNNNMVALACLNCHLLVILSKSSPSCPNCKYVHSLPPPPPSTIPGTAKSLDTLSLLN